VAERRRRSAPNNPVDYWTSALSKLGLLSPITAEATTQTSTETETKPKVEGEMKIFAERLIYTLCPAEKGYAPIIVRTVKSIYDVLEGRKDFGEWFTEVRQTLSLKSFQLAQIIYQCLEGLHSREARDLREQWFNFLQAEMKGYGMM
jgi:hypothetical protein